MYCKKQMILFDLTIDVSVVFLCHEFLMHSMLLNFPSRYVYVLILFS